MKDIKNSIEQILDQFTKEEIGNRLSQFAMLSLRGLILEQLSQLPVAEKNKD